jgi:hypothetical protein
MTIDELLVTWKSQDQALQLALKTTTFQFLLEQKSNDVLRKIRQRLGLELGALGLSLVLVDTLFFIVPLKFDAIRLFFFGVLNLVLIGYLFLYGWVYSRIGKSRLQSMKAHLETICQSLTAFRRWNIRLSLPIGLVGVLMFAGAQQLLTWLPWLLLEYGVWWWLIIPRQRRRFDVYLMDIVVIQKEVEMLETSVI